MTKKLTLRTTKLLTFAAVLSFGLLAGTKGISEELPQAADILEATKALQIPSVAYSVNVSHAISTIELSKIQEVSPKCSFDVDYVPGKGMAKGEVTLDKSTTDKPTPTVMVDLAIFLNEMLTFENVTVQLDNSTGRSQYILIGQDQAATKALTLVIDKETHTVSHLEFSLQGQRFAEIDFEYQSATNGYLLPSKIILHHFTDDSQANLELSNYTFKN